MTLPKSLISSAALGTAQHPVEATPDSALGGLLGQLDPTDQAARALLIAAALGLQQKAGWLPGRDHRPLPEPCPPDSTRPCSPRATRQLLVMLDGHYAEVLPEWLREAARTGQRAPEEALPLLLEAGHKKPELRELIWPVLGNRGRWLADQVKDQPWHWAASVNAEKMAEKWDGWSTETKVATLEAWRRTDPATARAFLNEKLDAENAAERARLVKCLAVGLSMEDEPFLESALDDGSQQVRQAVAELLGHLPQSRLCQRMAERAAGYLSFARVGMRRQAKIQVTLPSEIDDAMQRDGIPPVMVTKKGQPSGQESGLEQILSYVTHTFWVRQWHINIEELITAQESGFAYLVFNGWAQAAERIADWSFIRQLTLKMFSSGSKDFGLNNLTLSIISKYPLAWDEELTTSFLKSFDKYVEQKKERPDSGLQGLLLASARLMPPTMSDTIIDRLLGVKGNKGWTDMIDSIRLTLDFRREMLAALWND